MGRGEVAALRRAAEAIRHGDSRHGGGSAQARLAVQLLDAWALPLFNRPLTSQSEAELCSLSAELARLAGWAALDVGRHGTAFYHFDRALNWSRQADDADLSCYILATMALLATLRDCPSTALDMTQGSVEAGGSRVNARVLAFTRLVEARAHARAADPRSASTALAASERLLERASRQDEAPEWIDFLTRPRLASDAAEVYRDLRNPRACLAWNQQATAMAPDTFTRSVGMRQAVVATAHLQNGNLDASLAAGHRAIDILRLVDSNRARGYVRALLLALRPHSDARPARAFLTRAREGLGLTV
ncbi:sporulation protein [Streptomyces sp. SDr-06]|uniref:sporulation protein n=1 Tax=Streptomyces sp. SDr-06 TaxID=2267702 RepID=UPI0011C035F0|nr:sporulation protein [Streptomyces sp. SDr-06]